MSEYRDYGTIWGLGKTQVPVDTTRYGQVYQATHSGTDRLPYMRRSFISFSFGGRLIEDFNLIATTSGDRIERDGYSPFNDLTTSYDILEGQQYWGTHYKANSITFKLATDGIDQKMLDDFLHWFQAGVLRELILMEHPNRAQYARVSEPPQLSLLPFENHTKVKIATVERPIITTLYKGEIDLKLVMDEPHWYSKENILGKKIDVELEGGVWQKRYVDIWTDMTGKDVDIFASEDALKIIYEDGIPLGSMIQNNMLLGNKAFANVEHDVNSLTWSLPESSIIWDEGVPSGVGARIHGEITENQYVKQSSILGAEHYTYDGEENFHLLTMENGHRLYVDWDVHPITGDTFIENLPYKYGGRIAGPIVDVDGEGIESLAKGEYGHFFYAGTAPAPAIITFTFVPTIYDKYHAWAFFVNSPHNQIDNHINTTIEGKNYNSFTIESEHQQILKFTTPNFLTSYNRLLQIIDTKYDALNPNWPLIYDEIRDKVRHAAVRLWGTRIITLCEASGNSNLSRVDIKEYLSKLLMADDDTTLLPMTVTFNSKTGEAIGKIKYRVPQSNMALDNIFTGGSLVSDLPFEEDVGDMLTSNYIIINERNYPDEEGRIKSWTDKEINGKRYSHRIYHDMINPLTNIQIEYQNLYL